MRHLGSIVLSLLLTPVVYVLTGVGLVKFGEAAAKSGASKYGTLTIALAALLVAGVAYSVLMLTRLSPLGLVLAGLVLFAATMWAIVNTDSFRDTVPGTLFGVRNAGWAPASGVAALLAVPLLATIASPRRWRRYATPGAAVAPYNAAPAYSSSYPQAAAPSYGPPFYGTEPASTVAYDDPEATRRLPG
jgi:hypothetical protein